MVTEDLREAALRYHREPTPGKIAIAPSKRLVNQRDLSLAYSPGVAAACEAIVEDASSAAELTARGNLVAVVTNGTAVLGLGNIGPLGAKPVMEGKALLFQLLAGINGVPILIDSHEPQTIIDAVRAIAPTFGAIKLEDIRAPECFEIERKLDEALDIPVVHDDQHGTAIVVAAAMLEKSSGQDFETMMRRDVFKPLEMNSADFRTMASVRKLKAPLLWGHRSTGEPDDYHRYHAISERTDPVGQNGASTWTDPSRDCG